MGACISSESVIHNQNLNSALVISLNGDLRQYPLPVTSSQIFQMESLSPTSFFLCDSDNFFYDHFISPIHFHDHLEAAQIYFILPTHKLHYRLTASDMAALAVKASAALNNASPPPSSNSTPSSIHISDISNGSNSQKRKNEARNSPYALMEANQINVINHRHSSRNDNNKDGGSQVKKRLSKSGSIRKLQRVSSRRARLAVRSFRLRLSTIYEDGNALQVY